MDGSATTPHHALHSLTTRMSGHHGLLHQRILATDAPRVLIDGKWVLNFTSSNYLGLANHAPIRAHAGNAVQSWGTSHAAPRILATDSLTSELETAIAELVQREAVLLFPSTLHAAIDVLTLLATGDRHVLVDERAYPISVSAARLVIRDRKRLIRFRHDDAGNLERLLAGPSPIKHAVIVCDGVYPESGRPASLREIAEVAARGGATVFVDDAHGLGLLGANPSDDMPYGRGGGGSVLHTAARAENIVYVSSLSKALGVPLAFVAGSAPFIQELLATSASVVHSSPPAIPVVAAALATLKHHSRHGDKLRLRLFALVRYFQEEAVRHDLPLTIGSDFPLQTIRFSSPNAAISTGLTLRRQGIWPVIALGSESANNPAAVRFVITASHSRRDLDLAVRALADTTRQA